MRRNVQSQLGCLSRYTLTHIDRVANRVAEGLVSAALNSKNTTATCSLHPRSETPDCWTPGSAVMSLSAETEPLEAPVQLHEPVLTSEEQAAIARRGGGEVYPAFDLNVGAIPVRRLILRLRQLDDPDKEQAEAAAEAIASSLAVNISNTVDWDVVRATLRLCHTVSTRSYYRLATSLLVEPVGVDPVATQSVELGPQLHAAQGILAVDNSRDGLPSLLLRRLVGTASVTLQSLREQQCHKPDDRERYGC